MMRITSQLILNDFSLHQLALPCRNIYEGCASGLEPNALVIEQRTQHFLNVMQFHERSHFQALCISGQGKDEMTIYFRY